MRVMFIQHSPTGSMWAQYYFPAILARLGHEVLVVAPAGGDVEGYASAGIGLSQVEPGMSWFAAVRQASLSFRPDIVHVFFHAMCCLYPLLIRGKGLAPKFVLDIRSPLLKKGLVRYLIQIKNRMEIYFYHSILTHSIKSGYTVVGKTRRLTHVSPGVDFSILPSLCTERPRTETLRLVYVGSVDQKRQLEKMILGVVKAAQNVRLTLDIYADKQSSENLQKLVEASGAQDYIHFMGMMKRDVLFTAISEYDAGLAYVPRELYDFAPPLKTIEYLACGLPVIATATEGNRQFIEDGKNGVLTGWAPDSYAEGIIRLAQGSGVSMTPAEMRQAVEKYNWGKIVSETLIPEYRRVVGELVES